MALLTWNKKYSVGVKAMDDQHIQLIGLTNDFHAAMMKGQHRSTAGPLLHKVAAYVRDHFSAEEALMKAHKFPGLAEHQAIHKDLTRQAGEFMARYEKGDQTVYIPLLKAMRDAVTRHILVEDMKYAPWLKERGASLAASVQRPRVGTLCPSPSF
jgi:hemerythrin-like metal-binding protein